MVYLSNLIPTNPLYGYISSHLYFVSVPPGLFARFDLALASSN